LRSVCFKQLQVAQKQRSVKIATNQSVSCH